MQTFPQNSSPIQCSTLSYFSMLICWKLIWIPPDLHAQTCSSQESSPLNGNHSPMFIIWKCWNYAWLLFLLEPINPYVNPIKSIIKVYPQSHLISSLPLPGLYFTSPLSWSIGIASWLFFLPLHIAATFLLYCSHTDHLPNSSLCALLPLLQPSRLRHSQGHQLSSSCLHSKYCLLSCCIFLWDAYYYLLY